MNRAEIRNLIVEATGRTDKTSLMNEAINLAVAELSAQHDWSDLATEDEVTTTASSASVTLASDLNRLAEVRIIDDTLTRPLIVRPKTWVMERYPYPEAVSTARPVYGYLEGTELFMVPIPDTAYDLRYTYYKLHDAFDSDDDELTIRHASAAVVAYGVHWVFQSLEKFAEADRWFATYLRQMMSAKKLDKANSAVKFAADIRGEDVPARPDYYNDPFARRMP